MKQKTQKTNIREHLQRGHSITALFALQHFGCFRLSAIIWILRHGEGLKIRTKYITKSGSTFAEYDIV